MKTYTEMSSISSYEGRLEYLLLKGKVGDDTFGHNRHLNQSFYTSKAWRDVRNHVIARDMGNDMGVPGYPILGTIYVHHIIPITIDDLLYDTGKVLDMDNLISVSEATHNCIHYSLMVDNTNISRSPNDDIPWRK